MSFDIGELGDNYPGGKSDNEINSLISKMQVELKNQSYEPNYVSQLTPLVQLGLYELEKRKNSGVTRVAQIVGGISAFIAVIALVISGINTHSSSTWKTEQMTTLNDIKNAISTAKKQDEAHKTLQIISNSQADQQKVLTDLKERLNKELCVKQLAAGSGNNIRNCE